MKNGYYALVIIGNTSGIFRDWDYCERTVFLWQDGIDLRDVGQGNYLYPEYHGG
jgi:hypothetical protein